VQVPIRPDPNAISQDHADSLRAYAAFYLRKTGTTNAIIVDIVIDGFMLQCDNDEAFLIPFSRPLTSAKDIRKIAVEMHNEAYDGMGYIYKLHTGFYSHKIKIGGKMIAKKYPAAPIALGVLSLSVAVFVARRRLKK